MWCLPVICKVICRWATTACGSAFRASGGYGVDRGLARESVGRVDFEVCS